MGQRIGQRHARDKAVFAAVLAYLIMDFGGGVGYINLYGKTAFDHSFVGAARLLRRR
jgi:hypothetical protein